MFFYRADRNWAVLIEVSAKVLSLVAKDEIIAAWPIAVGKPGTPTPLGRWEIINKKVLEPGSIFGSRWLGLSNPGYGIHAPIILPASAERFLRAACGCIITMWRSCLRRFISAHRSKSFLNLKPVTFIR